MTARPFWTKKVSVNSLFGILPGTDISKTTYNLQEYFSCLQMSALFSSYDAGMVVDVLANSVGSCSIHTGDARTRGVVISLSFYGFVTIKGLTFAGEKDASESDPVLFPFYGT